MAHKYRIRKKLDKSCSPEKVRYYAIPVTKGMIRMNELAEEIAYTSTLTPGDVINVITAIAHFMKTELCNGNKICLDPIGTFFLSATSPGFDSPGQCKGEHVKLKRICFRNSPSLKTAIEKKIEFKKEAW